MDMGRCLAVSLVAALAAACSGGNAAGQDSEGSARVAVTQAGQTSAGDVAASDAAESGGSVQQGQGTQTGPIERSASLDDSGKLTVEAADLRFDLVAPECRRFSPSISICEEALQLSVAKNGGEPQPLDVDAIHLNTEATLFRGEFGLRARTKSQTIVVSDMNGDGHDDIALWTGAKGGYGGASYDIFLFDSVQDTYAKSHAFSDLTIGRLGLFEIVDGKIVTHSKSGCCIHTEEIFSIENKEPVLVERIVEDATGGVDPPKRTVSRRVNGGMQEVQQ